MADDLTAKLGELLKKKPWYELPRLLAMCGSSRSATSCARRTCTTPKSRRSAQTGDPGESRSGAARQAARSTAPTTISNYPKMGAVGCRFGRNVPLDTRRSRHAEPADAEPARRQPRADDARTVPAGDDPQPAGGGVDPVHGARLVRAQALDRPTSSRSRLAPGDDWARRACACRARCRIRRPPGRRGRRPTPIRTATGGMRRRSTAPTPTTAAKLRTEIGGKLRIEPTGLLPVDPETGVNFSGFTDNWWIGLAMLHTLVHARAQLRSAICSRTSIPTGTTSSCSARRG